MALGLMALALAASPAYNIRFHIGPLPTTLLEILLLAAIGAGLVALGGRMPWRNAYTWPALLLLLGATVDTVLAPDRRAALGIWRAYFIEPALAGVVISGLVSSRAHVRLLLAGLGVAGTIVALTNLGVQLPALIHGTVDSRTPQVAIYLTANAVPLYLIPLAAIALALVLHSEDRRERVAAGAYLAIATPACLLSYSKAGWLALAAVLIFVALFHPWRWRLLGAGALGTLTFFAVSHSARRRVLVELDPTNPLNTLNLRLWLWRSTANLLLHNPLVGGGLSGFRSSVDRYRDPNYHENVIYPHNLILNFWTETGLIGLAGFGWLAWKVLGVARAGLVAEPWIRVLSIGLLGLLVAFAVHGLLDVPYFKNDQALAFWAILGIHLGAVRAAAHPT